jgi:hypothetical protein
MVACKVIKYNPTTTHSGHGTYIILDVAVNDVE